MSPRWVQVWQPNWNCEQGSRNHIFGGICRHVFMCKAHSSREVINGLWELQISSSDRMETAQKVEEGDEAPSIQVCRWSIRKCCGPGEVHPGDVVGGKTLPARCWALFQGWIFWQLCVCVCEREPEIIWEHLNGCACKLRSKGDVRDPAVCVCLSVFKRKVQNTVGIQAN